MAKVMKASEFFSSDLDQQYSRATASVSIEEVKAFSARSTGVRRDHSNGKPNSSRVASSERSMLAAEAFLAPSEENAALFFRKFRKLYQIYKGFHNK